MWQEYGETEASGRGERQRRVWLGEEGITRMAGRLSPGEELGPQVGCRAGDGDLGSWTGSQPAPSPRSWMLCCPS